VFSFSTIKALRISLASPEQMRSWSAGEVTEAATISYRTLKPERAGLFCEQIFGPTKNWQCACGKYKGRRFKGKVCKTCGVLVAPAHIRRERMGHIELAAPVSHTWYAHGSPSPIALLLGFTQNELDQILAYTRYIVLAVDETARLQAMQRIEAELAHSQADQQQDALPGLPQESRISEGTTHGYKSQSITTQADNGNSSVASPVHTSLLVKDQELVEELIEELEDFETYDRQETPDDEVAEQIAEETQPEGMQPIPVLSISELQQTLRLLQSLTPRSLLDIEQYRLLKRVCGQVLWAGIGAEAIRELLGELKLSELARSLRHALSEQEGSVRSKTLKRLKIVEALRRSQANPQWMILSVIPVLPPDLRPVLQMHGGRFASSDLNVLYSRIIYCNNRLKRFLSEEAPEMVINHEKSVLQAACDALFDNAHRPRPLMGAQGQPLRSLTDSLRGKEGRFRRTMLGKRVDYSGRSVICVGLDLKLHQCGLPKKIALELFKPFIMHKLIADQFVSTPRAARRMIERKDPIVWEMLAEVMQGRYVLLNRAPTLHRMSIQAFEPVLVEGNAIHLHPQVCSAFNADFDGDQMAVHLPLSADAQQEARAIMLSTHNLLSPASGEPTISVSQDMVLGCFYLTQERAGKKGEGRIFADAADALLAYAHGVIDLQARIVVRIADTTIFGPPPARPASHTPGERLFTTAGRLLFNEILPARLRFKNHAMKKDDLKLLIWECIKIYGFERAAALADAIKRLGFDHATRAGISIAIGDAVIPAQKTLILARADEQVRELRDQWENGLITHDERYQRTIAIWHEATDQVAQQVQGVLDPGGAIATIASSGATKAKLQQIRQLSGMRGLMASPSGAVMEVPVRGNFLEGLSVAEYFLSSHGARKSLMDRSLNTAHSGYLTLRLVNVAQDVIVTEEDCGTTEGLLITDEESKGMGLADSRTRLFARILAASLPSVGLQAGDELDEAAVERIVQARITEVRVRSVLTCQARRGVCRKCYGWDLSKRALVQRGVAVGIIAAQSIGEPGTQLTMRTFHSGGIAGGQGDITQGLPRAEEVFEGRVPKECAVLSEIEGVVSITKDEERGNQIVCVAASKMIIDEYPLPAGSTVLAGDQSTVQAGQVIALLPATQGYSLSKRSVQARNAGVLSFDGVDRLIITREDVQAREYVITPGRKLLVSAGQRVQAGQPLCAGPLNPLELLRYRGREALARYILQEAQQVYRMTGAYIHDKHFEVIVRQMVRYVQVQEPGDTDLLPDDLVDRFAFADINAGVAARKGKPATALPVLLGLTRATLASESWLAAAAFQQTGHVLADAVLAGKVDKLTGLKENVIVGRRIPAGTGLLPAKVPPRKARRRK
jgi:DNA-directed RNA polymerase subunit beta'